MTPNLLYENSAKLLGHRRIIGIDESGVGCFSGSVYMAGVILPEDIDFKALLPGVNDSKQKSAEQREVLYHLIKKHSLAYSVASASVAEIDKLNIYWAKFLAARRVIEALDPKPDFILMDGNKEIPGVNIPQQAIVKGDGKSVSIACASILAKVERDRHIVHLADLEENDYGWKKNKSYYSTDHIAAIKKYGKSRFHREKYVRKFLVGSDGKK